MTRRRIQRINSLLKEVIAETVRHDLKNVPVPELITVTAVDTSNDIRHAKVYISLIEDDKKKKDDTIELLNKVAGVIAAISSKKVVLRYFPELIFKIDDSIENFMQIDDLLRKIDPNKTDEKEQLPEE